MWQSGRQGQSPIFHDNRNEDDIDDDGDDDDDDDDADDIRIFYPVARLSWITIICAVSGHSTVHYTVFHKKEPLYFRLTLAILGQFL